MQALRLARPRLPLRSGSRTLAAAATSAHGAASTASSSAAPVVPLSNVEAMWERLSANEQLAIHQQLEELQKKDWKSLTIDEKKAGASVSHRYLRVRPREKEAFSLTCLRVRAYSVLRCVRSPRPPCTRQPPRDDRQGHRGRDGRHWRGDGALLRHPCKRCVLLFTRDLELFLLNDVYQGPAPPRTITKEWEQASNERAAEQKMNPIHGTFRLSTVPFPPGLP